MGPQAAGSGPPVPAPAPPGLLDNIVVVLHQPEDVVNVGGVVRVMTNFGVAHLRLVEPAAFDPYRVEGVAHQGGPVIQKTRRFASLEQALADCSLVLATTGRARRGGRERLDPRQAAQVALQAAGENPGAPVALLFGRERDGLPNTAIDLSHALVTIPADPANHSLNLSHAAAIVLYEIWLAWLARTVQRPGGPRLATGRQREAAFNALADLLEALFPRTAYGRRSSALARLRALLLRAGPREDEAELLAHLFRHLARVVRGQLPGAPPPA